MVDRFTEDKIAEFKEALALFSDCGGTVGVSHLNDILRSLGMFCDEEMVSTLLRIADPEGEGTIKFHNFLNVMETGRKMLNATTDTCRQFSIEAFESADTCKTGRVAVATAKAVLSKIGIDLADDDLNDVTNARHEVNYTELLDNIFCDLDSFETSHVEA